MLCYVVLCFAVLPKVEWRVGVSLAVLSPLLPSPAISCNVLLYGAKSDMISCAIRCPDVLGLVMLPYVVLSFQSSTLRLKVSLAILCRVLPSRLLPYFEVSRFLVLKVI